MVKQIEHVTHCGLFGLMQLGPSGYGTLLPNEHAILWPNSLAAGHVSLLFLRGRGFELHKCQFFLDLIR